MMVVKIKQQKAQKTVIKKLENEINHLEKNETDVNSLEDTIADMLSNKKLNPIVTELFIRGRKLIFLLFLSHNLILLYQKLLDQILHIISL